MTTAVRSIRCPVPYRRAPLMGGLPAGLGRGGDSVVTPSPPRADEHSGQLSDHADAVPPHPSRRTPAGHARDGYRAVGRKGSKPVGGHLLDRFRVKAAQTASLLLCGNAALRCVLMAPVSWFVARRAGNAPALSCPRPARRAPLVPGFDPAAMGRTTAPGSGLIALAVH